MKGFTICNKLLSECGFPVSVVLQDRVVCWVFGAGRVHPPVVFFIVE
jgi:hypothetical protein